MATCTDTLADNGGIWLDDIGRSCLYYQKYNDSCFDTSIDININNNYTSNNHPCCICRGEYSEFSNLAPNTIQYDPIWAIVCVSFSLIAICILTLAFYFICHLYRNEKRMNQRLQKAKNLQPQNIHTTASKSEMSKTDHVPPDDDDGQYVPIPGDIGVNKQGKQSSIRGGRGGIGGDGDDDNYNDNHYGNDGGWGDHERDTNNIINGAHSPVYKVSISGRSKRSKQAKHSNASYKSNTTSNTNTNTNHHHHHTDNNNNNTNGHHADSSTSSILNNAHNKSSNIFDGPNLDNNKTEPLTEDDDYNDVEDEYQEIDLSTIKANSSDQNKKRKHKNQNNNNHNHHKQTQFVPLKDPSNKDINTSSGISRKGTNEYLDYKSQKSFHQSTRRRYSAELEFNTAKQRNKRRSSKFGNTRFDHAYQQTQDDMIFLSFEQYLGDDDDALMEYEEKKFDLDGIDNNHNNHNNHNNNNKQKKKAFNDVIIQMPMSTNYDSGNDTEDDENRHKQSIVADLLDIAPNNDNFNKKKNKKKRNKTHRKNGMIKNNKQQSQKPSINSSLRSSSRRITEKDFTRLSTRRVIKLFAPQEIKYNDIEFGESEFLGKGSFGNVVKAKYHEIDVAVKKLHAQKLSGQELLNFKREAAIMQKVGGHKHIARMYGFCTKPEICIVTEYYSRGSLHDIIKKSKGDKNNKYNNNKNNNNNNGDNIRITTEMRIQMSIEASLGIWHLHQQQVIHRDISARNLLVDKNWTVVVADLGMSHLKVKNGSFQLKTNVGPVKWMAPESIIGHEYSEKTDSYSFGITLYEIFSESEPYPGLLPLEAGAKVVHEGLRPSIDKNKNIQKVPNLSKLLTMLWKTEPRQRPDFLFVTQSLKKIKTQWQKVLETNKNNKR